MKFKAIGFDFNGVISDGRNIDVRVLDLVDKLKVQGYKLGLLSNFGPSGADNIRRLGVDGHFDVFHASGETGFAKPHPEAFIHLAESLGVEIKELVYIDDSHYSLSSATETGFVPILYESYEKLTVELTKLGIKIKE